MNSSKTEQKPLAPVQAAMLRERGTGREVVQAELRFKPGTDAGRVRAAWEETVAAVAVLSARFCLDHGCPTGWRNGAGVGVPWVELGGRGGASGEWLAKDRLVDFDWERGVPWRTAFWPEGGCWVWTFHHGLLDGRSITRILRHFLTRLNGGSPPHLEAVVWEPLSSVAVEEAGVWLREKWSGAEAAPPDFGGGASGTVSWDGGESLAGELEEAAARDGVTPTAILTWAWGQALARAAGAEQVIVGQVRVGAPRPGQAGFSMNTLPLPVRRHRAGTAAEAWLEVRGDQLALRAWETLAPEDLPMSGAAGLPWTGVLMVEGGTLFHQLSGEAGELLEKAVLHEEPGTGLLAAAYLRPELRLEVTAGGETGAAGARQLLEHWREIIRRTVREPDLGASHAARLPDAMEERLRAWEDGGPGVPGPDHLAEAWQDARARHATETALWTPGESVSYHEFGSRVDRVAGSLASAGVRAGQTVAVRAEQRSRWPLALIAVLCLGAVYMPLGPRIASQRLRAMVRQGSPELLLCCSEFEEDFGLRRVDLDGRDAPGFSEKLPLAEAESVHALADRQAMALLYTSGSTGLPKGVMLEHRGVLNEARWVIRALGLRPGDRMLQFSSPGFDASLEEMLSCLLSGATLVPRPEEAADDLSLFHEFVSTARVTVLDLPTAFWSAWSGWMRETGRTVPPGVRSVIIGGERAAARALQDWKAAGGGELWNSYGPTEASIVATAWEIGQGWDGSGDPPIGRPLPGYRVRVAGPDGSPMPAGAAGEIWIGGPSVGPGYFGQDDLTAAVFVEREGLRWYRTGDQARWDGEGRLHFLGRHDDQLKIRGQRIEPGEIVRLLECYPGVAAAHAGIDGESQPPVMAAWVRWEGEPPGHWQAVLRGYLEPHLPAAALPVRWAAVDRFTLTERGKLDRRALPRPEPLRHAAGEAPATPTEARIAARWESLLGVSGVGRQDSFFDLGGHSLAALQFFSWLRSEFGTGLPMTTLIANPVLSALARQVDQAAAGMASSVPVRTAQAAPLRQAGPGPFLFCVHGGEGGVFFYQNLADNLPPAQNVATIEAPALGATGEVEVIPVELVAEDYVAAVRRLQPHGPYHLAGYSYGGVVVYEMALQLRAAGLSVAFVGLFDTENPACRWRQYRPGERWTVFRRSVAGLPWRERLQRLGTRLLEGAGHQLSKIRPRGAGASCPPFSRRRALLVREAHAAAMDAYQPRPLDVPVVLFRTQVADDKFEVAADYGWTGLTAGLEIVETGGEHLTMFSKAHAPDLAREVAARLPAHAYG